MENKPHVKLTMDSKFFKFGGFFCFLFFVFCFLFFVLLFRAMPATYGSVQARGRIGATAAGLPLSHSNAGSKLHL